MESVIENVLFAPLDLSRVKSRTILSNDLRYQIRKSTLYKVENSAQILKFDGNLNIMVDTLSQP